MQQENRKKSARLCQPLSYQFSQIFNTVTVVNQDGLINKTDNVLLTTEY